jgi:tRNA-Thr(GGU) m(6)t(6)A37 methyltransferase TsaA
MSQSCEFKPIGVIHTPYKTPADCPRQGYHGKGVGATIELKPEYVEGLKDLDGFSHLILTWVFHQSEGFKLLACPPDETESHGVFATRSPHRPNPIGLTVVKLIGIEGNILYIEDPDMVEGTPLLDIKPYLLPPETLGEVRRGWLDKSSH